MFYRLHEFSEWGQCQILGILTHYKPASEEEIFDILVIFTIDPQLASCYLLCYSESTQHVNSMIRYYPKVFVWYSAPVTRYYLCPLSY